MKMKGKVSKINTELGYGFVAVKGLEEVFFSEETLFINARLEDFKVGQCATITIVETPRGLFASDFLIEQSSSLGVSI